MFKVGQYKKQSFPEIDFRYQERQIMEPSILSEGVRGISFPADIRGVY